MKKILCSMAKLPIRHQRWILKQLPENLLKTFQDLKGEALLKEARKYKKIPARIFPQVEHKRELPSAFEVLSKHENLLYIAIILYEGKFSWTQLFLAQHSEGMEIERLIHTKVMNIKPAARKLLIDCSTINSSFEALLEESNG